MLSARDCSCVLATSRLYSATLSRCWFSLICCCTVVSWLVAWLYFSTARSASWYTPCSFARTSRSRVFLSATGEAEAWVERAKERRRVPRRRERTAIRRLPFTASPPFGRAAGGCQDRRRVLRFHT